MLILLLKYLFLDISYCSNAKTWIGVTKALYLPCVSYAWSIEIQEAGKQRPGWAETKEST